MSWTVLLTGSARRDLRRLDPPVASRMLDALDRLAPTGQGDTQRLRGTPSRYPLASGESSETRPYVERSE